MVNRFLKVLNLDPQVQHLVDWGESTYSILGFSTAFEVTLLPEELRKQLVDAVCEFGLTKTETTSVRQTT